MVRSLIDAAIVAGGTGAVHFLTHRTVGDPQALGPAGVQQAGTAVVATAFILSLLVGQEGPVGLQHGATPESRIGRARRRLHPA